MVVLNHVKMCRPALAETYRCFRPAFSWKLVLEAGKVSLGNLGGIDTN